MAGQSILIREDDATGDDVAALLRAHLAVMLQNSPPGSMHALDLEALRAPDITFWTAWEDGDLMGCGALKALVEGHGEMKSMHTAERHRGRGVASLFVEHILKQARQRGLRRLSLETGSMEAFAPAHRLYARYGFEFCGPFAGYVEDPNSVFMTLEL